MLRDLVDPVTDLLLLKKSGSAGNRTQELWVCSQEVWSLDHRGGQPLPLHIYIRLIFCASARGPVTSGSGTVCLVC
jgi:hypothetical protein